jgi:Na+/H+ antiporter NhaD/arsenite permease-like protein
MVMAANIGGTATLIGDPPNIMIGSGAGLSFVQFLADLTVPCAIMMLGLEWLTIRAFPADMRAPARPITVAGDSEAQLQNRQLLRWTLVISGGVFVGFMTHSLTGMPASVPAVIGAALVLVVQDVLYMRTNRPSHEERKHGLLEVIENEIEWPTLTFFAFLFIAVGAAVETGLISTLASGLSSLIHNTADFLGLGQHGTILLAAMIILWSAGFLSALIDNIPFVAVSIPIVAQLITELAGGDAIVLWWALSLGACLGGNGTVIGASANVTVVGIADRHGERITFGAFSRFAIPVTVFTLLVSTAFVTAHIYLGQRGALYAGLAVLAALIALRFGTWGRKPAEAPSTAAAA